MTMCRNSTQQMCYMELKYMKRQPRSALAEQSRSCSLLLSCESDNACMYSVKGEAQLIYPTTGRVSRDRRRCGSTHISIDADADADADLGGRTGVLEEVTVMDVVKKICRVK
eukprot:scaffold3412_cov101-Skeletonema_marinoi.AAC.3